ncbi:MAG: dihydroneopterin aldolase [Chitinophagaceae bacterium]
MALNDIRLFAHHGLHAEERIWGNEFVVQVRVSLPENGLITELDQTVDYAAIHALVCTHMNTPKPLLEEVAGLILRDIFDGFPLVEHAMVRIQKMNPPLGGRVGSSEVMLER